MITVNNSKQITLLAECSMDIEDLLRAGNDILDDVMQAIDTNDYSGLGQKIRGRVRDVASEYGWPYDSGSTYGQPGSGNTGGRTTSGWSGNGSVGSQGAYGQSGAGTQSSLWQTARNAGNSFRQALTRKSYFLVKRVGKTGATIRAILGGLGLFVFGLPAIICLTDLIMGGGAAMLAGTAIFGLMTAVAGWLLRSGLRGGKLVDRYYEYGRRLGEAEYISIPELAEQTGRPEQEVRKDLLDMMQKGYLPQARMDGAQKNLILTDRAYAMYRQAEESRIQREAEEAAQRQAEKSRQESEAAARRYAAWKQGQAGGTAGQSSWAQQTAEGAAGSAAWGQVSTGNGTGNTPQWESGWGNKTGSAQTAQTAQAAREREADEKVPAEIRDILERGNTYIRKVRDVNDMIPDTEEMSDKLYRLEEITHRIFEQVKKEPASAAGLRRFMDYYLPTTEKLLDAYIELDRQPSSGDNITKTKQEIDEAMDVINDAFENLLNNLFENMAWDISSDISVMKTMMAQDGLTEKKPFEWNLSQFTVPEKEPVPAYNGAAAQEAAKEMPSDT